MQDKAVVKINSELDIVECRKTVRDMAIKLGFGIADQTRLVTTASELSRNIVQYAGNGEMALTVVSGPKGKGMKLVFKDKGPGFEPDEALVHGYSTGKGLGVGLPGSKRLMDEFDIWSKKDKGTVITAFKWLKQVSSQEKGNG